MCVFRAKQLWLTTPLAMKSPVPVVMSYIGISSPSGSIAETRSFASLLIATPSIDRLRVIAGSVVWKKRITSAAATEAHHQEAVGSPRPLQDVLGSRTPIARGSSAR